jgi:hypothetical protein
MAALFAAATTAVLNSLGRIAAFLFSWAMVGFFGKMPPKRQYLLAGIALLSLLWVIFLISIFEPRIINFLFLLNKGLENPRVANIIEKGSMIFVGVLPFVIGIASLFVDSEPPPTWGAKIKQVLMGFVIAPGFAIGMVLMIFTTVITLGVTYLKRLKTEHVPITLKKNGYNNVVRDLREALNKNGVPVQEKELPWFLKPPVMVMSLLAKSIVQGLVTPGAKMLSGENGVNIVIHPTDMVITGPKNTAMEARAIITQRVPFTDAYLTWEEKTQQFEDRITDLWRQWKGEASTHYDMAARLREIEKLKADLHKQEVPFEQWEVVFRELLQLEDELVSGRLASGEAPQIADPQRAHQGARNAKSPGAKSPEVPAGIFGEIAIATALLGAFLWWRNRGDKSAV